MSFVDTDSGYNPWDATIGPNGIPRINIGTPPSPASPSLPVENQTNYIMEPDLTEAQQGKVDLPPDVAINDAGIPFNKKTGKEIPIIQRPNVLPVAKTPDDYTFAWPKLPDIVGNVMAPLAAPAVATKAGEVVLGSGAVRTMPEVAKAAEPTGPFYSTLAQAVDNSKINKATPDQWLGYLKNQPGVKAEEINTVLKDLPEGPITKEALQGVVENNAVKLNEVVKGQVPVVTRPNPEEPHILEVYHPDDPTGEINGMWGEIINKDGKFTVNVPEIPKKSFDSQAEAEKFIADNSNLGSDTKYHSYQLPGGENYQEMLMTLPEKQPKAFVERDAFVQELKKKYGDQSWDLGMTKEEGLKFKQLQDEYFKAKNADDYNTSKPFKSSHWDEPNVLAHVRYNDRNVPVSFTPEEQQILKAHADAAPKLAQLKQAQADVGRQISQVAKPLEQARRTQILSDLRAGKISNGDAQRALENYESPLEIKPLQDKLETLRKQENDLVKSLGPKPVQKFDKSLHLEEWQSDLHQAGRDYGYKGELEKLKPQFDTIENKIIDSGDEAIMGNPNLKSALKMAVDKKLITSEEAQIYDRYTKVEAGDTSGKTVPDFPFKKNWEELALKRMLHKAATEGYDTLSWTPGEAQALRYQNEVRQKLNSVEWHNKSMGKVDPDGNKKILVSPSSGSEIELTVDKAGDIINGHGELKGKSLDNVLGKDIAKQILEKEEGSIDAKGYVMNSEGMKQAYDKRGVDILNSLAKKFGGKVESNIPLGYKLVNKYGIESKGGKTLEEAKANLDYKNKMRDLGFDSKSKSDNEEWKIAPENPIHVLKLTPELKARAKQGFPLFSSTPILNPVNFDPFNQKQQSNYKLTPVPYDPFK